MIDALERWLIRSLERSINKPHNKPLQALQLLPAPTAPGVKLSTVFYARNMFVIFAASVMLGFLALVIYFIYLVLSMFTLHQIQHHYRAMLHIAFTAVKPVVLALCILPFGAAFLFAADLAPSVWAWNRRADRLNREAITSIPADVPDAIPGVWPPPPRTMP